LTFIADLRCLEPDAEALLGSEAHASSSALRWRSVNTPRPPNLETKRLLSRLRRLDVNALQLEQADLGRRAARRRKTTGLTARRQDPVAGDDQRHRIVGHGLPDIACGLWPGAEFPR